MFLLVSVRHVGAHPGEHQHGVSIQISISLGLTAAGLAQSVERLTAEREVAASIPGAGPILRVLK